MQIVGNQQIANFSLANGGSGYSVNDVLTAAGGTGTAATFKVLTLAPRTLVSVAINDDGSGYEVDDVLTVAGGTGTSATIKVDTVDSAGAILTAEVLAAGSYTVAPTTTANVVTGGHGTGAKFDLTLSAAGVVATVEMTSPGTYSVLPTLTENAVTDVGAGSGAKITLIAGDSNYAVAAEAAYSGVTTNNDPEATYKDVDCTIKEWGE